MFRFFFLYLFLFFFWIEILLFVRHVVQPFRKDPTLFVFVLSKERRNVKKETFLPFHPFSFFRSKDGGKGTPKPGIEREVSVFFFFMSFGFLSRRRKTREQGRANKQDGFWYNLPCNDKRLIWLVLGSETRMADIAKEWYPCWTKRVELSEKVQGVGLGDRDPLG